MKKALLKVAVMLLCLAGVTPAMAQFNLKKAVGGAVKAAKAVTLSTLTGWISIIRFVQTMIRILSV